MLSKVQKRHQTLAARFQTSLQTRKHLATSRLSPCNQAYRAKKKKKTYVNLISSSLAARNVTQTLPLAAKNMTQVLPLAAIKVTQAQLPTLPFSMRVTRRLSL
jgi:hypothetical protein